jgi:hypothetical protein
MIDMRKEGLASLLRPALAIVLFLSILYFAAWTIHWPMLGDASLMHYVVFLLDRGAVPYRDIAEMNMPGSYLVEWLVVHIFGGGQLAWRIFDLGLGGVAIAAMTAMTLPADWFAGFWAGSLLLLVHGRDGILQLGQRDLTLSVCLLAAYAFLFWSLRKETPSLALAFGIFAGFAATIKPTMLLLGPVSLLLLCLELRRKDKTFQKFLLHGTAGWFIPGIGALLFLSRERALHAFFGLTSGMLAYHASLARQSVGYLLLHSFSPLMPLVAIWLVLAALRRAPPATEKMTWEKMHLWVGLTFGLSSYLLQAKGYSYQRYPVLAFLLLLMAIDFSATLKEQGVVRFLGIGGLVFGGIFLAPVSAAMAARYDYGNLGMVAELESDLKGLSSAKLSGGVQCIDSIAGCTNVLYRMKLPETSYVFYDEFLFGPDSVRAVEQNREKFWSDIQRNPPEVIIVSDRLFPDGPDDYQQLFRWPQFNSYLQAEYALYIQRDPGAGLHWGGRTEFPAGYRIYLRKRA